MKKLIAVLLTTAMLVTVCSCWRKKPKPTETTDSDVTTETGTEMTAEPSSNIGPDYSNQTFETVGPNYTGTFAQETSAPRGQQNVSHKYYSADEVMNILVDLSTFKTGDSGKAYWDKVAVYRTDAPEQSPIFNVEVSTPDEWCPSEIKPVGDFTVTTGSCVTIKLFIYDREVMEGVYEKTVDRIKIVCGGIAIDESDPSRFDNIVRVTSEASSAWGTTCFIEVSKDYEGRWDKNGYFITVCLPVPIS